MSVETDERIIAVRQRWAARGMVILSAALSLDLMIRVLLLKQEPNQYMDIFLIWAVAVVYVTIGTTASGVEPLEGKTSRLWLLLLIIVIVNAIMMALMGQIRTVADLVPMVIGSFAGFFLMYLILRSVYRMWERRTLRNETQED
jgi:predicted neutral ceramidase superfamily lipid hydrolase